MEAQKRWLIRTHDHYILGPISEQKVKKLLQDQSLHPLDEICQGNGFWIYVREHKLVQQYLFPSSEEIFVPPPLPEHPKKGDDPEIPVKYPDSSDLDYPEEETPIEMPLTSESETKPPSNLTLLGKVPIHVPSFLHKGSPPPSTLPDAPPEGSSTQPSKMRYLLVLLGGIILITILLSIWWLTGRH